MSKNPSIEEASDSYRECVHARLKAEKEVSALSGQLRSAESQVRLLRENERKALAVYEYAVEDSAS